MPDEGPEPDRAEEPMQDLVAEIARRQGAAEEVLAVVREHSERPDLSHTDRAAVEELRSQVESMLHTAARAVLELSTVGWAFSGLAPLDAYGLALEALDRGDPGQADEHLVAGWRRHARHLHLHLRRLDLQGDTDEVLVNRARLIEIAWDHHQAGEFAAVVPLLFAQVDGITIDATGGKEFFSGPKRSTLIDNATLAGLDVSLPVARSFFDQGQGRSKVSGSVSRHAVLHGRELGYDTELNAAKAWSLLAAVIDFATPRLQAAMSRRRIDYLNVWADTDALDSAGRRRDDRGFDEAYELLNQIQTAQRLAFVVDGRYSTRPPTHPSIDLTRATIEVTADGTAWWAKTGTPSGWIFAMASSGDLVWIYDGGDAPRTAPGDGDDRWILDDIDPLPPNWRGWIG
ncbi:MAG: hypothetical protein JNK12_25260 [Acidimicrobiales bacterium]|nr:hypothetical protein [Acidimicrobiales bacterium]